MDQQALLAGKVWDEKRLAKNKFAPHALQLSPRQDRGVLRRRKPKTARYANFKDTNYNAPPWQDHGKSQVQLNLITPMREDTK